MTKLLLAIALTLTALPCATGDVRADDRNRLPDAVSRIERETGGRVLSAERRTRGGREVSRIKVYTPEGRVKILWDDPQRDRARENNARERGASPESDRPRSSPFDASAPSRFDDPSRVVQRGLPEPIPSPEPPSRRDDGASGR